MHALLSGFCLLLLAGLLQASTQGRLEPVAFMQDARAAHSATTLADGRVLIAGGFNAQQPVVKSVELFDPALQVFSAGHAMHTPRHSHSATLLEDGQVLLAGGYDTEGHYLQSAELFNPVTGAFTQINPMQVARADHTAVRLADGRVMLIAGVGTGWTFLDSVEIFDPNTQTFTLTGSLQAARESHASVRLADGRVLVLGGHKGRGTNTEIYRSAEIYDPETNTFTFASNMTIKRHKHDAVLLADGRVLITGGTDERDSQGIYRSAEIYDPRTNAFQALNDMCQGRYKHEGTTVLLADENVLLAGGANQAEIYNPTTGNCTLIPTQKTLTGQFSAITRVSGGAVLITGGYAVGSPPQAHAWLFHP